MCVSLFRVSGGHTCPCSPSSVDLTQALGAVSSPGKPEIRHGGEGVTPRRCVLEHPICLPIRAGGRISEGWPLRPRQLPPRVGSGSSVGLGKPALHVCWTSADAWLLVQCGEQSPRALPPTLGQRVWRAARGPKPSAPQRQRSAQVRPWVPSAVSRLSRCGRPSAQCLQRFRTLEGPRAARQVEPGPLDRVSCRLPLVLVWEPHGPRARLTLHPATARPLGPRSLQARLPRCLSPSGHSSGCCVSLMEETGSPDSQGYKYVKTILIVSSKAGKESILSDVTNALLTVVGSEDPRAGAWPCLLPSRCPRSC